MATRTVIVALFLGVIPPGMAFAADANKPPERTAAAEWPNWRGPNHDGLSTEKGWITAWPKQGPKQLWKTELGPGHSSVAVLAGKVYTMGRNAHAKQDTVFCLNADTGETVWKYSYHAGASAYGGGPRATPAVDGKAVYAVSADGQVFSPPASGRPGTTATAPTRSSWETRFSSPPVTTLDPL